MKKYYIKQLIIKGEGKTTSTIEFSNKLTVITGPSNTGKTYILKIIDFIFGKENLDINKDSGYTDFTLVLSLDDKDIVLSRKIDSNKVIVNSNSPYAGSGVYSINIDSDNSLNNLLLGLIGINDASPVPYNSRYEMKRFSNRMLLHSQIIYETEIERTLSILLPKETTSRTYYLSHLLFLLYAQDFSIYDTQEDPKITKARKTAVKTYIQKKMASIEKQLNDIATEQTNLKQDVENPLDELYEQLDDINNDTQKAIDQVQNLLKEISQLSDNITNCDLQIKSYETLKSQYVSDINRLSFVLEATQALNDSISNSKESICPFCNSKFIQRDIKIDDVLAINAEVSKISSQLNDLVILIDELYYEKTEYVYMLKEKQQEREKIDTLINSELKVKKVNIEKRLKDLETYMGLKAQLQVFESMMNECNQDLENLDKKIEKKKQYRPRDSFEKDFQTNMTTIIQEILGFCNKAFATETYFDLKEMDIFINKQPKGINGKGYKAYYNTIVVLALRKYLNDVAVYKPSFYIIDTPLHGLDQGELEKDYNRSLRRKLYNYFVNTMNDTQLIIIDNDDRLPKDFDFNLPGVKKIAFTQNDTIGRYGLFEDYRGN